MISQADSLSQIGSGSGSGSGNDFTAVLNSWREADLTSLLSQIHSQSSNLQEVQTNSLISRKKLAEQTREFKKQSKDYQLDNLKPLLKSYQTEIDDLTKRSKSAESALISIRTRLAEVKDPLGCLEIALEQAAALTELSALKESHATLQTELSSLKRDHSSLTNENNSLTQENRRISQELGTKTSSLESSISSKYEEKIKNLTSREEILLSSLRSNEEILQDLRKRNDSLTAKLVGEFNQDEKVEMGDENLREKERNFLEGEIFQLKKRNHELEIRNENLIAESQQWSSGQGWQDERAEFEKREMELKTEIESIQSDSKTKLQSESSKRTEIERENAALKKKLSDSQSEIEKLKKNLDGKKDYEELKREVEIMRMVEFNVGYEDEDDDDDVEEEEKRNGSNRKNDKPKSLESLLIEKNKKLEREVTNLRVSNSTLENSTRSNSAELNSLRSHVSKLKILNEKLEEDLINLGGSSSSSRRSQEPDPNQNSTAKEAEGEVKGFDLNGNREKNAETEKSSKKEDQALPLSAEEALAELESLSSIPSTNRVSNSTSLQSKKPTSSTTTTITTPSSSSSTTTTLSLIPILTSQRDRFKTRNSELEEELRKQSEIIRELRNEITRLNGDNLGLYEKVRYLSNYRDELHNDAGAASGGGAGAGAGFRSVQIGIPRDFNGNASREYPPNRNQSAASNGAVEDGYRERYEQSMNPFEAFRGREQNRILSSLNPLERILHMLTRLVLGHRRMRLLFMIYALVLHILVFVMLMEVGWNSSTSHERLTPVEIPNPKGSTPGPGPGLGLGI